MRTKRKLLILSVLMTAYAMAIGIYTMPRGWIGLAFIAFVLLGRKSYQYSAYGTARWATISDIPHMLYGPGLIIGNMYGKASRIQGLRALFDRRMGAFLSVTIFLESCRGALQRTKHLVRLTKAIHIAVFAPPGAGKNVSCVFPMLLTNPHSFIVLDPKGENAKETAGHRASIFKQKIVLIDPFRVRTQTPSAFNVLENIDPNNPKSFDQIRAIAEALVMREPNAVDPHWPQKAEEYIATVITAVVNFCPPEGRNLQAVAETMANKEYLNAAIKKLMESEAHGGLLSRMGHKMGIPTEKELSGILSTADRALAFLNTPAVMESTMGRTGFNPNDLRDTTIFLILPLEFLRSHANLMRLWIATLMRNIVSHGIDNHTIVNVLLDEAASLGHLPVIDDMLNIGRGFGIRITAIYQNMGQLMACWPNGQHQTFLGATSQVFFGVNDQQTAEYVSNRLGEKTIIVEDDSDTDGSSQQSNQQGGGSSGTSTSRSRSRKQIARKLLKPEEVIGLHERTAITFTPGVAPIFSTLIRYYEKDWATSRGIAPFKAIVDTVCLLLVAAMLAAMATVAVFFPEMLK